MALIMKSKAERGPCGPTLVVAKLSLLPQWEEELATKTNLVFKIHYGNLHVRTAELADVVRLLVNQHTNLTLGLFW